MVRVSLLSAAIAAATLAHAIPPPTSEIIPGRYIVEFEPSASPARNQFSVNTNTNTNGSDKDSAGGATLLGNLGIRAEIKHRYDATFSGMAVQLSNDSDIDRLRNAAGVKRVTPVYRHHIQMSSSKRSLSTAFAADGSASSSPSGPTPPGPEVAEPLRQVHNLTDLLAARSKYNLTGKGIKVGIVDSGIDYTHPDLGGCFGPGCRVAYGYDFVDKTDVKDCLGHGTLVAGIIGAARTSTVSSVAPDVTFGAYRIGSCEGEVDESNVVAAVDQAVKDGSDVINLSMGWYPRYPWDPLSTAVRNAAKKGVTVVTAGGNTGPRLYTVTTPAVVSETITVGAVDNLVQAAYGFNVSFAGASQQAMLPIDGFVGETGDKDLAAVGTRQLAVAMSGDRAANCTVSKQSDLAGKFVVWEQSDESCGARAFVSMLNVKPSAVIIPYLDGYQRPSYNASAAIQAGIPAFTVSKHTHVRLKDVLSKGPATVSGVIGMRTFDNPTAGELSIWSSRGPSAELLLKPQVLAPGGSIFSTAPASLGLGSYMVMSGTSFAAPYVSGLVALYLQQFGKQSPEKIQAAIMNSARTKIPREAGLFDGIDSPANIGSGVVNASAFLDPNTSLLTPSQVSLNDTARAGFFGTYVLPLTITNNAKTTTMYDLVHEPSVSSRAHLAKPQLNSREKEAGHCASNS
ncbi:subtilisin-like protein [Ramicandelaber brevisporus]|nr:subtilisin-like protein [Ramicandelaber brevisporus]